MKMPNCNVTQLIGLEASKGYKKDSYQADKFFRIHICGKIIYLGKKQIRIGDYRAVQRDDFI